MPLYLFRCTACGTEAEHLLPLGETADRPCGECSEPARHRFARIAEVEETIRRKYGLVSDTRGKDFKALRESAEKISDE